MPQTKDSITLEQLKAIFDKHDHNHTGNINFDEAQAAVKELGTHARHVEDFAHEFDKLAARHSDHDTHHIRFEDFKHFSVEHHPIHKDHPITLDELKSIFNSHDHNHTGRINFDEAKAAVRDLGKHARHVEDFEHEFDKLAQHHDDHDTHHITFEDFKHFSTEHHPIYKDHPITLDELRHIFNAHDHNHTGRINFDEAKAAVKELRNHARHMEDFEAEFDKLASHHSDHDTHHITFEDFKHFSKEHHPTH